jgi:hypothetical protein
MNHRVIRDLATKFLKLIFPRQISVQQQVCNFQESALFSQLFDGIATIAQNALATIDKGNATGATRGGRETGIVGEVAKCRRQCFDFQCGLTFSTGNNR